jgi:drug/metabolite transporter (DMT)-like permease
MAGLILLAAITALYAGYNLFIKLSGAQVPAEATTTILATIGIQLAALLTSGVFLSVLLWRGGQVFSLSSGTYFWSAVAGICICGAEIGYLYLFGGVGLTKPMDASVAIPTIVSGTIVIALLFSYFILKETITWNQILGCLLILGGIIMFFVKGITNHS